VARRRAGAPSPRWTRRSAPRPGAITLVRFWTGFNQTGSSLTISGPACTPSTTDIDLGWSSLYPFGGQVSSVGKNPDGHCNWQLRGPNGGTSTWVEGSRNDLRNLGDGWNDRAVDFRLT
jgi:hypothetical protein